MKLVKGRVIKIKDKELILWTPQGEFVEVHKPGFNVVLGDEISAAPISDNKIFTSKFWAYSAIAACLLVFILNVPFINTDSETAAFITVDINPSIEIAVNEDKEVQDIKPLNNDGKTILQKTGNTKYLSSSAVLKMIVNTAAKMEYLNLEKTSEILIVVSPAKEFKDSSSKIQMNRLLKELSVQSQSAAEEAVKQEKAIAQVDTIITSFKERQESEKLGISVGKYIFLQKMNSMGYNVTAEELKNSSITKIIEDISDNDDNDIEQNALQIMKEEQPSQALEENNDQNSDEAIEDDKEPQSEQEEEPQSELEEEHQTEEMNLEQSDNIKED